MTLETPEALCRWLLTLDNMDDVQGREDRRTVRLSAIIDRARRALAGEVDPLLPPVRCPTLAHLTPDARVRAQVDQLPDADAVTLDKADVRAILADWQDAAVSSWWAWHDLERATTITEQAAAIVELSNHMSDLCSWLPGYDPELGRLRNEDEERA